MARRAMSPDSTDSTSSTLSNINVVIPADLAARSSVGASSSNSTPPTSSGDSSSIRSDAIKIDAYAETHQLEQTPEAEDDEKGMFRRPSRRSRKSVATYNVKMLAGTTLHTPTKYLQKHIDNVLHDEQVQEQLEAEQQREATADSEHAEQGKNADDGEEKQPGRRSTRRRASIPTYNLTMLAGTAVHIPTKYLEKHTANVMRDREISSSMLAANDDDLKGLSPKKVDQDDSAHLPTDQLAQELRDRIRFSKLPKSRKLLFEATHNAMTSASSSLGKRSRDMLESGKGRLQSLRTTRRTQSDGNLLQAAKRKRLSTASTKELDNDSEEESEDEKQYFTPQMKKWLGQGLYIGQHRDFDARLTETQNKAKRKAAAKQENKILPMPMFAGERLLSVPFKDGRDFKLPFDVYSPLPRKAKPEDWKKTSRNLFVGEAGSLWKKGKVQSDSYCLCSEEDGCGEDCPNRYMFYECDSTNCHLGPELCTNRAFAELKRRAKGNRYDYGVEVLETKDRGFGVRAMRTFEPYQIIVEYAGEIITQDECDRRMKHEYKNNECYYLMIFHNKMIIDATRGSIARFVNHSCEPNCRMIKWTVAGEPRMALFAGERGIMTGEELTYDYNFDPFSSKNVQECRCGTRSCRGVLGPRPKDKPKFTPTSLVAGAKRKIQEVFGTKESRGSASPNKKRKVADIARTAISKTKNTLMESQSSRDIRLAKEAAEAQASSASRAARLASRSSSTVTLSSRRSITLRKPSTSSLRTVTSTNSRTGKTKAFLVARATTTARQTPSKKASTRNSMPARLSRATPSPSSSPANDPATVEVKRSTKLSSKSTSALAKIRSTKAKIEAKRPKPQATPASKSNPSLSSKTSGSSLRQTTIPFKRVSDAASKAAVESSSESEDESEDDGAVREFAKLPSRALKRPSTATSVRSAAATVKKNVVRSVRGPRRAAAVAKMGLGLGVNRMGGLGEGGSGSTIRVITRSDE